jgi:hypothetical protein
MNPQIQNQVDVLLRAYCLDCKMFHDIKTHPGTPLIKEMASWEYKHRGHKIEFVSPERYIHKNLDDSNIEVTPWWLGFKENTNFQLSFVASTNMTFTSLNSLASDTNLLAGASALAVDNGATGVPLEIGISGLIKLGSSPTVNREIDTYAYAAIDDVPTYPDTMAGTDATKTVTTIQILNTGFKLIQSMLTPATSAQVIPFAPVALSALFGVMPRYWSVWVVHNTGVNLAASGHQITYKGVYVQG